MISIVYVDDSDIDAIKFEQAVNEIADINFMGHFYSAIDALDFCHNHKPDIVFTDIEMPDKNGIWLANELKNAGISFVFITNHSGYSLQAFELFALHYIIKPISIKSLEDALIRFSKTKNSTDHLTVLQHQFSDLFEHVVRPKTPVKRLFVYNLEKINVIQICEILYLEAEGNYTKFHLRDKRVVLSTESLKKYDELLLNHPDLIRVHRSFMMNKNFVNAVIHDKHLWYALLENNVSIEISRLKKDWVLEQLGK